MYSSNWLFTAGYCKIKTARQKRRLLKEDLDKRLLRLDRERNKLHEQRSLLPWIPLATPYQKGWKRTFALREDVMKCSHADFYQTILSKINTINYSNNKSFTKKKRRRRKKVHEAIPQRLREFYLWEWNHPRCKLTEEEKAHFHPKEYWSKDRKTMEVKFAYNEPWRFTLQISPHMITHVKMVDEVLEQQIWQLNNYIERRHFGPAIQQLIYGEVYDPRREMINERERNPLKNKSLHQILEAVYNNEL